MYDPITKFLGTIQEIFLLALTFTCIALSLLTVLSFFFTLMHIYYQHLAVTNRFHLKLHGAIISIEVAIIRRPHAGYVNLLNF
jgi:hypothetical protein